MAILVLLALLGGCNAQDPTSPPTYAYEKECGTARECSVQFYGMCKDNTLGKAPLNPEKDSFAWITDMKTAKYENPRLFQNLTASDASPITQHLAFYCGMCDFLDGSMRGRNKNSSSVDFGELDPEREGPAAVYFDFQGQIFYIAFLFLFSALLPTVNKKFGPNRAMSASGFMTENDELPDGISDEDKGAVDAGAMPTMYGESTDDAQEAEDEMEGMFDGWLTDNTPKPIRVIISKVGPCLSNLATSLAVIFGGMAYFNNYVVASTQGYPSAYCFFQFAVAIPFYPPLLMPIVKLVIKCVKLLEKSALKTKKIVVEIRISKNPLKEDSVEEEEEEKETMKDKLLGGAPESVEDAEEAVADAQETVLAIKENLEKLLAVNPMEEFQALKDMNFGDWLAEPLDEFFTPMAVMITNYSTYLSIGAYFLLSILFFIPPLLVFFPVVLVAMMNLAVWSLLMVTLGNFGYILLLSAFHYKTIAIRTLTGNKKRPIPLGRRISNEYQWVLMLINRERGTSSTKFIQNLPINSLASFGFTIGFGLLMVGSSMVLLVIYLSYFYAAGLTKESWMSTADAVLGGSWFKKDSTWADGLYTSVFSAGNFSFSLFMPKGFTFDSIFLIFNMPDGFTIEMYDLSIFLGYFAFGLDFGVEFVFEPLADFCFNTDRADAKILMNVKEVIQGMEARVKKDLGKAREAVIKQAFKTFNKNLAESQEESTDAEERAEKAEEREEELDEEIEAGYLKAEQDGLEKKKKKKPKQNQNFGKGATDIVTTLILEGIEYKKFNNKNHDATDAMSDSIIQWLGIEGECHVQCKVRQFSEAEHVNETADDMPSKIVDGGYDTSAECKQNQASSNRAENSLAQIIMKQEAIKELFKDHFFTYGWMDGVNGISILKSEIVTQRSTMMRLKSSSARQSPQETLAKDLLAACPAHLPTQKDFKKRKVDVFKGVEGAVDKESDALKKEWLLQVEETMSELRGNSNAVPAKTQLVMNIRQKQITQDVVSYKCKVFKKTRSMADQKLDLKNELLNALKELKKVDDSKSDKELLEETMNANEVYSALLTDLRSYSNLAFGAIKNNSAKLMAAEAFEKGGLGALVAKMLCLKKPDVGNNIKCELTKGDEHVVVDAESLYDGDKCVIAEGDEVRLNIRKATNEELVNGPVFYTSKGNLAIVSEISAVKNGKITITLGQSGSKGTFKGADSSETCSRELNFREPLPRPEDVWERVTKLLTYWLHRADISVLKKKYVTKKAISNLKKGCCGKGFFAHHLSVPQRKALREELRKTDYYNKLLQDVHIGEGSFKANLKLLASLNAADTGADGDDDAEQEEVLAVEDDVAKDHDKQFKKPIMKKKVQSKVRHDTPFDVPNSSNFSITNGTPTSFTLGWADVHHAGAKVTQYQVSLNGELTDVQTEQGLHREVSQEELKDRIVTKEHDGQAIQSLDIGTGDQNPLVSAVNYSVKVRAIWSHNGQVVEGKWSTPALYKTQRTWPSSFLTSNAGEEQSYVAPTERIAPSFMNTPAPFSRPAPPVPASQLETALDAVPGANPVTKDQLTAYFKKYNPENVANVEAILATYEGNSAELRKGLKAKYGADV